MLPSVSEGLRASPPSARHSQPGDRAPSSDETSFIPAVTSADGVPGTALPVVNGGPSRSPSRRAATLPSNQHVGGLVIRYMQQPSNGDGTSRFYNASVTAAASGNTVTNAGELLACHSIAPTQPAWVGAANPLPNPPPATPPRISSSIHAPCPGSNFHDRLPLSVPAAPPLAAAPPALGSGSGRGRRSLPVMGFTTGPTGRPSGARRSVSPNSVEQPAAARAGGVGGAYTPSHGTMGAAASHFRTPLQETPSSPRGPRQPRPPLQVPTGALLDDPSSPSLHSGSLLSPRVMRLQLGPPAQLHPLGPSLRMPSARRQAVDPDDPMDRSSAPEWASEGRLPGDSMTAASAAEAAEAQRVRGVVANGDAKQMAVLSDLAAAVCELQRRVAEMTPRLPRDTIAVSDAGSGYSWCPSTRSSAPGNVNGDSGNLGCVLSGVGLLAPAPGAVCSCDERLAVLETQAKQLAAAAVAGIPLQPPAAAAAPVADAAANASGASGAGGGGGSGGTSEVSTAVIPPPPFWSDPEKAAAFERRGRSAATTEAGGLAATAAAMGLALGLVAAAAMPTVAFRCGGGAVTLRRGLRCLPLSPIGLFRGAVPAQNGSQSETAAEVAATAAATTVLENVQLLERRITTLTTRLAEAERAAAAAQSDSAATAAAAATAEAAQQQLREQLQQLSRAVASDAVASDAQANVHKTEQLEERVRACEEQVQQCWQQRQQMQALAGAGDDAAEAEVVSAAARPRAAGGLCGMVMRASSVVVREDEFEFLSSRLLEVERAVAQLAADTRQTDGGGGTEAAVEAQTGGDAGPDRDAAGPAASEWRRDLQALSRQIRDMALQVTSARAQASSVAAEVQAVLEQVRGVQATAATAAAGARQAKNAAAAAERSAAAALDVVDAAATAARATGGRTRRCRSSSGVAAIGGDVGRASTGTRATAIASKPGDAGGLRSPRRSEVWLAEPRGAVPDAAPAAFVATVNHGRQQRRPQVPWEEQEQEDDDSEDEAQLTSRRADVSPRQPALRGRRLAARDVGFRIMPDGADVTIGGEGATLYGVSASRANVLEAALSRLAVVETSLQDLRSKLGRGLALRVTRDELRESFVQVDMKLRAVLGGHAGGAGGGQLYSRSASLAASIGLRAFSAAARLVSDGGGHVCRGSGDATSASGDQTGDGGAGANSAAAAAAAGWPAGGQAVTAWPYGRRVTGGGGGGGGISDSVSSRGEGRRLAGDVGPALVQLQRSVGLVEHRLEVMEASVAQCGAMGERMAEQLEQLQAQLPQPLHHHLQGQGLQQQQQQSQGQQAAPESGLALAMQSHRSSSLAMRFGSSCGGGGGAVTHVLDMHLADRTEASEGAQSGMEREARGLGEQAPAPLLGQASGARGLTRSGARSGALRGA